MYSEKSINIKGELRNFDRPWIMGIVNITPDSFFSGSRTPSLEATRERIRTMVEEGVDCLDLGGYSSRPGADDVTPDEEYRRLCIGLEAARLEAPGIPVSIDTFRAAVAAKCIREWGADIINDISGGTLDPEMWQTVADLNAAYILMHMRGNPATMQQMCDYNDVTCDVLTDLQSKVRALRLLGVNDIILDPGFGFAKTVDQNFQLLAELQVFQQLHCPVLAGVSRKSMIWKSLDITPAESLNGTTVLNTIALSHGADILRVHDVREAVQARRLVELTLDNTPIFS